MPSSLRHVTVYQSARWQTRMREHFQKLYGFTFTNNVPTGDARLVIGGYSYAFCRDILRGAKYGVVYWLGSDVLAVIEGRQKIHREARHWCGWHNLVDELATVGVEAKCVPHMPWTSIDPTPPGDGVLVYVPVTRWAFYFGDLIKAVDAACPRPFYWGPDLRIPVADALLASRCALRFVEHDGFSMTASEAILAGRSVVTNLDRPYQYNIKPIVADILAAIELPPPGREAIDYYRELLHPKHMEAAWLALMSSS